MVTFEDALSYINTVKEAFRDEPYKYQEFIKIIQHVINHRHHEAICVTKVEELMKDHPNLFQGFKPFLKRTIPPEANATIPPEAKPITPPDEAMMMIIPYEANTTISPEDEHHVAKSSGTKRQRIDDTNNFMDKVKIRFETVDTYKVELFCKIMNKFKKGKMSGEEAYVKVVNDVLYYHEDLVQDFSKCFPQDYSYLVF